MRRLICLLLAGSALGVGTASVRAASPDDAEARLATIEKENADLKRANAALRARVRLQSENAALRDRLGVRDTQAPAARMPVSEPPAAYAAAIPVYKAAPAAVATQGAYAWIDGSWKQVNLPDVALGLRNVALGAPQDNGAQHSLRQRLNGGGVRGGIGYNLPGTYWRAELGASYLRADGSSSASAAPSPGVGAQLLNGATGPNFFGCGGTFPACSTTAALTSDITAWQLNGKLAYDWRAGPVLLSPSLALFGGHTNSHQSLSETFSRTSAGFFVTQTGSYAASTALGWTDFGGRIGLDANIDVNSWLTLGAGGYVGVASRTASLSGSDVASSAPTTIFDGASAISAGASTTAFVANGEVGAAIRVTPLAVIRGFAGVNFDKRTPGISSPSFTGVFAAPTSTTAAGILFNSQTSYYAGGGLVVRFGAGPVYAKN
jgi:hypothetical protein